jgi:hypothetical protein
MLVFMTMTAVLCLTMPLFMENMATHWFNVTITIDLTRFLEKGTRKICTFRL